MATLLLYHDFTSPFCRLALEVASAAAGALTLELEAVPFELRPSPEPLPPADDPVLASELSAATPLARELDVALRPPPRLPRTRKAHEAVVHARGLGLERPMLTALYEALWRDGADIGRLDVIAEVGGAAGVEREPLHVALGVDDYEEHVVAAQRRAEAEGITGVPSFRLGERVLVGLVPVAELVAWLRDAGAGADADSDGGGDRDGSRGGGGE